MTEQATGPMLEAVDVEYADLIDQDDQLIEGLQVIDHNQEEQEEVYPQEWAEYREYIRQLKCVACQWKPTSLREDQRDAMDLLVPELAFISDPHHVKTRGSGGLDAENRPPVPGPPSMATSSGTAAIRD